MNQPLLNSLLASSAIATVLLSPINASATDAIYLKIDGVTGESLDDKHKSDMDVLAWSWGESKGSTQKNEGKAVPVSCITDLSVTKYVDSATPHLITGGVTDTIFANATLSVEGADSRGSLGEYFSITMSNVSIVSYQTGGPASENRLAETITLHFNTAHGQYIPHDQVGRAGTPVQWDVAENGGRGNRLCP